MLQVGVHDNRGSSRGMVQSCGDGDFLAEIAAERDSRDATLRCMQCAHNIERVIARTIIDEDDLEAARCTFQNRHEPLQERPDIFRFVQDRDNDAQFGLPVLAAIEHRSASSSLASSGVRPD